MRFLASLFSANLTIWTSQNELKLSKNVLVLGFFSQDENRQFALHAYITNVLCYQISIWIQNIERWIIVIP